MPVHLSGIPSDLDKLKKICKKEKIQAVVGGSEPEIKIIAKNMKFTEQSDLYLRIQRLLSPRYMGDLFKVILAYNFDKNNFAGFK